MSVSFDSHSAADGILNRSAPSPSSSLLPHLQSSVTPPMTLTPPAPARLISLTPDPPSLPLQDTSSSASDLRPAPTLLWPTHFGRHLGSGKERPQRGSINQAKLSTSAPIKSLKAAINLTPDPITRELVIHRLSPTHTSVQAARRKAAV